MSVSVDELAAKLFEGLATEQQFAAAVDRDVRTVRRWRTQGLPTVKRAGLILIPIAKANKWLLGEVEKAGRGRPRN